MRILLGVLWVLSLSVAKAEDFKIEEVPSLKAVKLMVAEFNPNLHVLQAKDPLINKTYLIINDNGKVYVPQLLNKSSVYFYRGTLDLHLENGSRILLPTTEQKYNYVNTTLESAILYPDRAPDYLKEIEASEANLSQLGFSRFIEKQTEQKMPVAQDEQYKPLKDLGSKVIFRAVFEEPKDSRRTIDYSLKKKLEETLNQLSPDKLRVMERGAANYIDRESIIMIADPEMESAIKAQFPEGVLQSLLKIDQTYLEGRLKDLEKSTTDFSNEDKIAKMKEVFNFLVEMNTIHSFVESFVRYETAVENHLAGLPNSDVSHESVIRDSERHHGTKLLLRPLREASYRGYRALHLMNHPLAREIIVETADYTHGSGITLLDKIYFKEWLNQMRAQRDLIDLLPVGSNRDDEKKLELDSQYASGSFENLKVGMVMYGIQSFAKKPIYFKFYDYTSRLPMQLLGLPGDKTELKREFIQYVVESDKKAQKNVDWQLAADPKDEGVNRSGRNYEARGDYYLHKLLSLSVYSPNGSVGLSDYSDAEYRLQMIDIYRQLIEIAPVSLINDGTYLTILDSSYNMISMVERLYGLDGQKQPELSKAAVQLLQVLNLRLQKGIQMRLSSTQGSYDCAALLAPNLDKVRY